MESESEKPITPDRLAAMLADADAQMVDHFATLESHVGDIEVKLIAAETTLNRRLDDLIDKVIDAKVAELASKIDEGFAGVHRLIGGISHTIADHEHRIRALEGE